jgi:hypothetical protein
LIILLTCLHRSDSWRYFSLLSIALIDSPVPVTNLEVCIFSEANRCIIPSMGRRGLRGQARHEMRCDTCGPVDKVLHRNRSDRREREPTLNFKVVTWRFNFNVFSRFLNVNSGIGDDDIESNGRNGG